MRQGHLALLFLASISSSLYGAPARQQYILLFKQLNASAPASIAAVVQGLGGSVDARGVDRLLISLPDQAVDAIRQHGGTKYLQRAVIGAQPVKTPTATSADAAPNHLTPATNAVRLQPISLWESSGYAYDGAGNITSIGTTTYTYDSLSRLTGVSPPIADNAETYAYDRFGNTVGRTRNQQSFSIQVDSATNHLVDAYLQSLHDTAGNLTNYGSEHYFYDPFSNMLKKDANSTTELYVYTASDERIGVRSGPDRWLWSIRDENGQLLRQYESFESNPYLGWTWIEDYVYRDAQLLGAEREPQEGGRRHFHLDHLGTPRVITSTNGQIVSAHDYYPFGNEITPLNQESAQGFSREEPMKFTGQERDFTNGTVFENANYIDYMHARHSSPGWGRFLSVDVLSGHSQEPQSWNRYTYVTDNPIKFSDPTGLAAKSGDCDYDICVTGSAPDDPSEHWLGFGSLHDYLQWVHSTTGQAVFYELGALNHAVDQATPYVKAAAVQAGIFLATEGFGILAEEAIGATLLSDVAGAWEAGSFESSLASLEYHYGKHAAGRGILQFTRAAQALLRNPGARKVAHLLKDGRIGIKVTTKSEFGIYTLSGRIISYGGR